MDNSHRQAQGSVDQVGQAVSALRQIGDAVTVITDMNLQIASAAEEHYRYCRALAATVCHAVCCLPLHWPTLGSRRNRMTSG